MSIGIINLQNDVNSLTLELNKEANRYDQLLLLVSDIQSRQQVLTEAVEEGVLSQEEIANQVALQDQFLNQELNELQSSISNQSNLDLSAIVAQWNPYVFRLTCEYNLSGRRLISRGSAVMTNLGDSLRVTTNAHVLTEDNLIADRCLLSQPESQVSITIERSSFMIDNDTDKATFIVDGDIVAPSVEAPRICQESPKIGDQIVTLGYPAIGSQEAITATEGIMSGFDGIYFTTSAKIERGNSGGAAILTENNCLLGLPTLVVAGRIESLARILPLL